MDTETMVIEIVGPVLLILWTWFKGSEYWARLKDGKYDDALVVVEAAVFDVYEGYVREIKVGRADGKLTTAERIEARKKAYDRAVLLGGKSGLSLLRILGPVALKAAIQHAFNRAKEK